jgi:CHAD domain-containing protein
MEIEAKYAILDEETGATLKKRRHLADLKLSPGKHLGLIDTYYDTPEGAIRTAGLACRRREVDDRAVLSLKGLGSAEAGIHRREEIEIDAPDPFDLCPQTWPEGPFRDRVLAIVGDRELVPLFTIEQDRLARNMHKPKGPILAELAVDTGRVVSGKDTLDLSELEIELQADATPEILTRLLKALETLPGLVLQPTSKFERGLAFVARTGRQILPEEEIAPDDLFEVAVAKALHPHFFRMQESEAGTYAGLDPEALHDMRVATRRMRTIFWIAAPYLAMKSDPLDYIAEGLRTTAGILGAVRDMDVFRQKTEAYLLEKHAKRRDFSALFTIWDVEYTRRRNELLVYLGSRRYGRFKEAFWHHLSTTTESGALRGLPALAPGTRAGAVVPSVVRERLAVVLEHSHDIGAGKMTLSDYHRLRIDLKRLRYTLEFFHPILGPEAGDAIEILKKLQDSFGDLQDAVVAVDHLQMLRRHGTWEAPRQPESLWQNGAACGLGPDASLPSGLRHLLRARKAEIKTLLTAMPGFWQRFHDEQVPKHIAAALAPLAGV